MMQKRISKAVRFQDGDGYLHGFTTGVVRVKSNFRTATSSNTLAAKFQVFLDKSWTEWMPIWVWVVEHPEGIFVVDTGENAKVKETDYFKGEGKILEYINTRSFQFQIEKKEEVGLQLERLGYKIDDVAQVILTHLHLDHFDGLSYFEHTPIAVHDYEWKHPSFALPSLYPEWFEPKLLQLKTDKKAIFSKQTALTTSNEMTLIHTPGHTKGHCSVLLKTLDMDYLLAGDVTYNQMQLEQEILAGGHQSFRLAKQTFRQIKNYAQQRRLIYLPSHDAMALERIAQNDFLEFTNRPHQYD